MIHKGGWSILFANVSRALQKDYDVVVVHSIDLLFRRSCRKRNGRRLEPNVCDPEASRERLENMPSITYKNRSQSGLLRVFRAQC